MSDATKSPQGLPYYIITDDKRVLEIMRRFESANAECPAEYNGRQNLRTYRKGDSVFIEIVSTYKLTV